jgi:hypothetical protein
MNNEKRDRGKCEEKLQITGNVEQVIEKNVADNIYFFKGDKDFL